MHLNRPRALAVAAVTPCVALAVLAIPIRAHAAGGVETESVDRYNDAGCTGASDLSGSNTSANSFYNNLQAAPNDVGFYGDVQYQDTSVWDSDFLDPDLSGAPCSPGACDDTDNFDQSGNSVAFYQGHGAQLTPSSITCTAANYTTQCAAANAPAGYTVGLSGYGSCALSPMSESAEGSGTGLCYYIQATTVNPTADVCGNEVNNHNHAQVGYMALGENTSVGAWRGAGTNGGISMAVFHMSFGAWTFFPLSDWGPTFAGLQLYAGMTVSWDDVDDAPNYGGYISQSYASNPNGEVAEAYVNGLSLLSHPLRSPRRFA